MGRCATDSGCPTRRVETVWAEVTVCWGDAGADRLWSPSTSGDCRYSCGNEDRNRLQQSTNRELLQRWAWQMNSCPICLGFSYPVTSRSGPGTQVKRRRGAQSARSAGKELCGYGLVWEGGPPGERAVGFCVGHRAGFGVENDPQVLRDGWSTSTTSRTLCRRRVLPPTRTRGLRSIREESHGKRTG